jgi:hypothetical protein
MNRLNVQKGNMRTSFLRQMRLKVRRMALASSLEQIERQMPMNVQFMMLDQFFVDSIRLISRKSTSILFYYGLSHVAKA